MKCLQLILSLAVAAALTGCDNASTPFPINGPAASTPPGSSGSALPSTAYTPGYATAGANPRAGNYYGIPQPAVSLPPDTFAADDSADPWPAGYIPQIIVPQDASPEAQWVQPQADIAPTQAQDAAAEAYTAPVPYYVNPAPQVVYVPGPTYIEYVQPIYIEPQYYPYPDFGGIIVVDRFPHRGDRGGRGDDHNGDGRGGRGGDGRGPVHAPGPVILPPRPPKGGASRPLTINPPTPIIGNPPSGLGNTPGIIGNPPPGIANTPLHPAAELPKAAGVTPPQSSRTTGATPPAKTPTPAPSKSGPAGPIVIQSPKPAAAVAAPTPPVEAPRFNPPSVRTAPPPQAAREAPSAPVFVPDARPAASPPERFQPAPPPPQPTIQQSSGRGGQDNTAPQFRGGLRGGQ